MRQGVKFVRTVGAAYGATFGTEIAPGPTVQTDQQIEDWLVSTASTQFHPTGSCAMLPQAQGGVVNAKLQVYGLGMFHAVSKLGEFAYGCVVFLANVRVADSAVFPFEFAAHVRYYFPIFLACISVLIVAISLALLLMVSANWRPRSSKPTLITFCSMQLHRLHHSRLPAFWLY